MLPGQRISGLTSGVAADHFVIYSKPNTLPLVAFGLKKAKDRKTGELVDR